MNERERKDFEDMLETGGLPKKYSDGPLDGGWTGADLLKIVGMWAILVFVLLVIGKMFGDRAILATLIGGPVAAFLTWLYWPPRR